MAIHVSQSFNDKCHIDQVLFLAVFVVFVSYHAPYHFCNIMHNGCVFGVFAAFKCVPLLCAFVRLIVCGEASLD